MAIDTAPRPRARLSMTSLIDVIFLLLLFFMLSSTFSRFGEIALDGAGAAGPAPAAAPTRFLRLDAARLLLDGVPVRLAELPERLAGEDGREQLVLISVRDGASSQQLVDLLAQLRALPGLRVSVLG